MGTDLICSMLNHCSLRTKFGNRRILNPNQPNNNENN